MKLTARITLLIGAVVLLTAASITIIVVNVISNKLRSATYRELHSEAKASAVYIRSRLDIRLIQLYEIANRARTRTMDWKGVVQENLVPDVSRIGVLDLGLVFPDGYAHFVLGGNAAYLGDREHIRAAFDGKNVFSDLIVSRVTNQTVLVPAVPIFENDLPDAPVIGVLLARMDSVGPIYEIIKNVDTGHPSCFVFIVDRQGTFISYPDEAKVMDQVNIIQEAQNDPSLISKAGMLTRALQEKSGVTSYTYNGRQYIAGFAEIPEVNWILFVAIESGDFYGEVIAARNRIIAIGLICLLIGIIISIFAGRGIAKPIVGMAETLRSFGDGDLNRTIPVTSNDEIGVLAASFNKMTNDIRNFIANLTKVTAEKERIGAELNVATHIQASMLPNTFPPFPDLTKFDIYAVMQPAKEVGGDFYDFFMVDVNTLAVVIADVSGKGVPAALFMVIAKTLIKNNAQYGKNPKEVFDIVNNVLCENNDTSMFVTGFLGYYDIPNGKFTYVNAGHNPPLLKRANGDFDWLSTNPELFLAGFENTAYNLYETTLTQGDVLLLYTDGVTEAVNPQNEIFTDPALLTAANKYKDSIPKEFLFSLKTEIEQFTGGAEQSDDITMLALRIL